MTDKKYILPVQMKSAMKPAQYPRMYRRERRKAFWRAAIILMCISFVGLFILVLEIGVLDPIYRSFLK